MGFFQQPVLIFFIFLGLLPVLGQSQTPDQRPKFRKAILMVDGKKLNVEVAETEEQRAFGLMHKDHLKDDEGMLFIFKEEEPRSFWMKNTLLPLSIGFINKNNIIIDIQDMKPVSVMETQPPVYESKGDAKLALEVNLGWFKKHNVREGAKIKFK